MLRNSVYVKTIECSTLQNYSVQKIALITKSQSHSMLYLQNCSVQKLFDKLDLLHTRAHSKHLFLCPEADLRQPSSHKRTAADDTDTT